MRLAAAFATSEAARNTCDLPGAYARRQACGKLRARLAHAGNGDVHPLHLGNQSPQLHNRSLYPPPESGFPMFQASL